MSDPHYHINLFWSEEDKLWIADVPDLKHCSSHGRSPLEAVEQIRDAMEGWLETAREIGLDIPEPSYRPAAYAVRDAA